MDNELNSSYARNLNLIDRLITAQPQTTLRGILQEYREMCVLEIENESRQLKLSADINDLNKEINDHLGQGSLIGNFSNGNIYQLKENSKLIQAELLQLIEEISGQKLNLRLVDDKLKNQTLIEKMRIDKGWEAENKCYQIKDDYNKLLIE